MDGRTPPPLWRFLSFTQNFGLQPGTAFSHAWSLCVEEQFYLVLPLVVVAGFWSGLGRRQGWMLLFALVLTGVAARSMLWLSYGRDNGGYHPNIYYATLCRFDEFLPGVAVAMVKNFHRPAWQRITRHGQRTLAAGALATAVMLYLVDRFYDIDGYGYGFFMTAAGYSLVAMAFAVLVVAALSPGSWLHRVRIPGAYHIALWSYSIYLSHKAIAVIAKRHWADWGLPNAAMPLLITMACVAVGALLYRWVEAPFMALRAQWFPSSFADEGWRAGPQVVAD
jgi:peptidoglycan/LPS O-acetylase OafA/YrhL